MRTDGTDLIWISVDTSINKCFQWRILSGFFEFYVLFIECFRFCFSFHCEHFNGSIQSVEEWERVSGGILLKFETRIANVTKTIHFHWTLCVHLNPIFFSPLAHNLVFSFFRVWFFFVSHNNDTNFAQFQKDHLYLMNGKQSKTSNVHRFHSHKRTHRLKILD